MIDFLFFIGIIGYFFVSFFAIRIIRKHLILNFWFIRSLILSFAYAIFFGLGAIGGGGDPGFTFPAPVIFAAWYAKKEQIIDNSITPLLFWWALILIVIVVIKSVKLIRNKKGEPQNEHQLPTT